MKTLRTILISRNAYSWQYGGAEKLSFNMASALQQNHDIRPIVVSRVPELIANCRASGIATFRNLWLKNETQRRWILAYYLLSPILILQYVWLILTRRVDLLVLCSRDDQIFGTMAAAVTGRKVIWVDHGDMKGITSTPFRFMRRPYYWALDHASRIVTVSAHERSVILGNLDNHYHDKFAVIGNGSTKQAATPRPKPKGAWVATFIGRLEQDKGILDLVTAAISVCAAHPEVHFWIAGKGSEQAAVEEQIRTSDYADRIELLGHVDNVYDVLSSSDLFVYPSYHDAGAPPLAIAEALLAGLPIVATNVGGIAEAIDTSCGILVEPGAPSQLADAISALATGPKRYKLLQAGARKKAPSVDYATVVAQSYVPLFQEVLND